MKGYDAVVIGGGPAGATAARYLSRHGGRVVLVEKDLNYAKPCGGGVPSTAFEEFGISEDPVVQKIRSVHLFSSSGEKTSMTLDGGFVNIVERKVFDQTLRRMACDEGVELIEGAFVALRDNEQQVHLEVKLNKGKAVSLRAALAIGCDGVNSRVRRAVGLPPVASLFTHSEIMEQEQTDSCEFWFGSQFAHKAYSWVFPRKGGISVGTGARDAARTRNCFNNFLTKKNLSGNGYGRGYKLPLWNRDALIVKRVLLAGDAAAHVMPLTYEGIYYGMKSGQIAAESIIKGNPFEFTTMWDERFGRKFRFTKKLERYFLKSDSRARKLITILKNPSLKKATMDLWLQKEDSNRNLVDYIKLFGKFLH